MKKGEIGESKFSLLFHRENIPALFSSQLLRSLNLGQIDVAYLKKNSKKTWVLYLIEVKSTSYPAPFQHKRLLKTQEYLSKVLEIGVKLEVKFCQKDNDSLFF